MKTGEGKTLVSTLPAYLNALPGEGVHIVTVNDYLARRDAEWMGVIHRFLGLEVGVVLATMQPQERRPAYDADITYGTNNEFGFDYLRDNMAVFVEDLVQRGHAYAIVDEVDSILVDEARTPLIISGATEQGHRWYQQFARLSPRLHRDTHYEVDEGKYTVAINEAGIARSRSCSRSRTSTTRSTPPGPPPAERHPGQGALQARRRVHRARRRGPDRRRVHRAGAGGPPLLRGLHQAIEAKESVPIKEENQTYATITLQNYFRMYDKIAGMTGTAKTEAAEFNHIYKLGVVEVPTNRPMIRQDHGDVIYKSEPAKFEALVDEIAERHDNGQPILVGTVSIEKSERVNRLLEKRGIKAEILNAKHHEREVYIIAQAGRLGAVTVATNMAGRGVDIMLGGNVEYLAEESLRAKGMDPLETLPRSGTRLGSRPSRTRPARSPTSTSRSSTGAGWPCSAPSATSPAGSTTSSAAVPAARATPGESRFYLSLEDDLMRMFATKTVGNLMEWLSPDDVPITHRLVTRAIANAQRQVESQNFERRKNVLKYDEVMNKQRQVIYETRRQILEGGEELRDQTLGFLGDVVSGLVAEYCPRASTPRSGTSRGSSRRSASSTRPRWIPSSSWTASTTTSSRTCSWRTPSAPTRHARPSSAPTSCTRSSAGCS